MTSQEIRDNIDFSVNFDERTLTVCLLRNKFFKDVDTYFEGDRIRLQVAVEAPYNWQYSGVPSGDALDFFEVFHMMKFNPKICDVQTTNSAEFSVRFVFTYWAPRLISNKE